MADLESDIEFLKTENVKLHAETLALQTLLFSALTALVAGGNVPRVVIEKAFDCSEDFLTGLAVKEGKTARPEHTLGALRIIEQLREQFLAA